MKRKLRSTVPKRRPPKLKAARPPRAPLPRRSEKRPALPKRQPSKREVARIIDDGEKSLVDVLDSLLNQGVVLNADLVLALANVDLVYVRLSALLCAADRVLPRGPA